MTDYPRVVTYTTATIKIDGAYWIAVFADTEIVEKTGPYKTQRAADADGPRVAQLVRDLARTNNIPTVQ